MIYLSNVGLSIDFFALFFFHLFDCLFCCCCRCFSVFVFFFFILIYVSVFFQEDYDVIFS